MPQMDKLSTYRTTFEMGSHGGSVTYISTKIVSWDANGNITLNSGGWQTVTTKRKMTQAARQFALGYCVSQRKGDWFVSIWNPTKEEYVAELPFRDGMTFNPVEIRVRQMPRQAA